MNPIGLLVLASSDLYQEERRADHLNLRFAQAAAIPARCARQTGFAKIAKRSQSLREHLVNRTGADLVNQGGVLSERSERRTSPRGPPLWGGAKHFDLGRTHGDRV